MKLKYQFVLLALAMGLVTVPGAVAQDGDTLWVDWQNEDGTVIMNALQQAIANDTDRPPNRVYGLFRSGLYYNSEIVAANNGYHLRIVGSTVVADEEEDFGPPVIQMFHREDGSQPGRLITVQDDLTLKNVWVTGQTNQGSRTAYLPIFVEASDRRIVVDNVIFERTNFSIIGLGGAGNRVYITNSIFRNHDNSSQQWEGRGIRFEAGGDSLVMENNTFLNFGHTIVQSEAQPVDYVRFNHNTVINVGRTLNSGSIWKSAFFTNNLAINWFWHGEGSADFGPNRTTASTGWFGIAELPPAFGTNLERQIVYANNAHWRDPRFESYYADSIVTQPLFNEVTQMFWDTYENMVQTNNQVDVNPELPSYTSAPTVQEFPETSVPLEDIVPQMIQNMRDLREGGPVPFTSWIWDPGRDPGFYQAVGFVYPLPEDFAYTNASLMTAGTDGLPLGDLNWFPAAKATFEANKEQYIQAIENMAEAPEISVVTSLEAEDGDLDGAAVVSTVEGFTYFRFESGGFIEWTFDLPDDGTLDLHVSTNMGTETRRGQRIIVNGTHIRNHNGFGEYFFCTDPNAEGCDAVDVILPTNEWAVVEITQDLLIAGAEALTLNAGTNTIRLEPSWGFQNFSGIDVVDPVTGDVVVSLTAPMAQAEIAIPFCEDAAFCPQGFQSVEVSGPATIGWNMNAPASGEYFLRIFYHADGDVQGSVLVDGAEVLSGITFEATEEEGGSVVTNRFNMNSGVRNLVLSTSSGDMNVDFVQVLGVNLIVGTERNELPEGYALDQNYPNPFNPVTTIRYEMAAPGEVTLTVFDLLGRRVRTLVQGPQAAGVHQVQFDGSGLSSGVYFYRIEMPVGSQVRKMTLVK